MKKIKIFSSCLLFTMLISCQNNGWSVATVDEVVSFIMDNIGKEPIYNSCTWQGTLKKFDVNFDREYLNGLGKTKEEATKEIMKEYFKTWDFDFEKVGETLAYEENILEYYTKGRFFFYEENELYTKEMFKNNIKEIFETSIDTEEEKIFQKHYLSNDKKLFKHELYREYQVKILTNEVEKLKGLYSNISSVYIVDNIFYNDSYISNLYYVNHDNNSSIVFNVEVYGYANDGPINLLIGIDLNNDTIDLFHVISHNDIAFGTNIIENIPKYVIGKKINEIKIRDYYYDFNTTATYTFNALEEAIEIVANEYNNLDISTLNLYYQVNVDLWYKTKNDSYSCINDDLYETESGSKIKEEYYDKDKLIYTINLEFIREAIYS